MKRKKLEPKKGAKVILIETYVKSANSSWDAYHPTIYLMDTKRRVIWEVISTDITWFVRQNKKKLGKKIEIDSNERHYHEWLYRVKPRSIASLVQKYDRDFDMLSNMLKDYELQVTELGVL